MCHSPPHSGCPQQPTEPSGKMAANAICVDWICSTPFNCSWKRIEKARTRSCQSSRQSHRGRWQQNQLQWPARALRPSVGGSSTKIRRVSQPHWQSSYLQHLVHQCRSQHAELQLQLPSPVCLDKKVCSSILQTHVPK